jgi:arylsulfatase A-like enzyme
LDAPLKPAFRHRCALALVACAALAPASACARRRAAAGGAPRHLLLVTLSGVRADHTSALRYPRPTTAWPVDGTQRVLGNALSIDDLAAEGLLCAEAWAPAEDQLSALKALFTGRATPFGEVLTGLESDVPTLAERFRDAGSMTAAFVSGAPLAVAGGFERGFEHYVHRETDAEALAWAVRWLYEADFGAGRPLFLWIHLAGAEPPWEPGVAPPTAGIGADTLDYLSLYLDPEHPPDVPAVDFGALYPRSDAEAPAVDRYDGEIAELSSRLRSFLLAYRALGRPYALFEDSAVVIAGLSGTELGEHGWSSSLYAPALRVPLVFYHPSTVPGRRITAFPLGLEDLAPTLCDWLGVAGPPPVRHRQGRSLLPLLSGEGVPDVRPVVSVGRGGEQRASLRDARHTLVWSNVDGKEDLRLFDRFLDPLELHDVAAEHPKLATKLRNQLVWLLNPKRHGFLPRR